MPTKDRPKELRIRYDQSTTYTPPLPLACMYSHARCDCVFCEAAVDAFYCGDFAPYVHGVQRWVDWLHDRVSLDPVEYPCLGQSRHLSRWLTAERTRAS